MKSRQRSDLINTAYIKLFLYRNGKKRMHNTHRRPTY